VMTVTSLLRWIHFNVIGLKVRNFHRTHIGLKFVRANVSLLSIEGKHHDGMGIEYIQS
jgi:hypothetical protein